MASLSRGAATPLLVILLLGGLGAGSAAHAQFKVRYPIVDYREFEIEHFGDITFDKPNSGLSNNQRYTIEYGFGPLPNWFVELGHELAGANGENITYDATEIESYLQLTPTGKYFGDLAMFADTSIRCIAATRNPLPSGRWRRPSSARSPGLELCTR